MLDAPKCHSTMVTQEMIIIGRVIKMERKLAEGWYREDIHNPNWLLGKTSAKNLIKDKSDEIYS